MKACAYKTMTVLCIYCVFLRQVSDKAEYSQGNKLLLIIIKHVRRNLKDDKLKLSVCLVKVLMLPLSH